MDEEDRVDRTCCFCGGHKFEDNICTSCGGVNEHTYIVDYCNYRKSVSYNYKRMDYVTRKLTMLATDRMTSRPSKLKKPHFMLSTVKGKKVDCKVIHTVPRWMGFRFVMHHRYLTLIDRVDKVTSRYYDTHINVWYILFQLLRLEGNDPRIAPLNLGDKTLIKVNSQWQFVTSELGLAYHPVLKFNMHYNCRKWRCVDNTREPRPIKIETRCTKLLTRTLCC